MPVPSWNSFKGVAMITEFPKLVNFTELYKNHFCNTAKTTLDMNENSREDTGKEWEQGTRIKLQDEKAFLILIQNT